MAGDLLQDRFYKRLKGREVVVYLQNGIRLTGVLRDMDKFVLILNIAGEAVLVYKGSISTVSSSGLDPLKRRKIRSERGKAASGSRHDVEEKEIRSLSEGGKLAEVEEDSFGQEGSSGHQDPLTDFEDIIS